MEGGGFLAECLRAVSDKLTLSTSTCCALFREIDLDSTAQHDGSVHGTINKCTVSKTSQDIHVINSKSPPPPLLAIADRPASGSRRPSSCRPAS